MTYMRNPESDLPNFYCEFIMVLGFFGLLVIFVGYGLMSKRFRHGLRGKNAAMSAKYKVVKGGKISESIFKMAPSSKNLTRSRTLKLKVDLVFSRGDQITILSTCREDSHDSDLAPLFGDLKNKSKFLNNFEDEMKTLSENFPPFKKIMSNRPLQVYQDLQQVPHRVIASRLKVRLKLCLK